MWGREWRPQWETLKEDPIKCRAQNGDPNGDHCRVKYGAEDGDPNGDPSSVGQRVETPMEASVG